MKWTVCVILQVVRVLLENHCSPDITDNQGLTAAELAEKCSHDQCAKEIKAKVSTNHSKVLILWGSRYVNDWRDPWDYREGGVDRSRDP